MKLAALRAISATLDADLNAVFAKHGLKMTRRSSSVAEEIGTITFRIEVADENFKAADGTETTPEREFYKQMAGLVGMKPEWLNQPFRFLGAETYVIVGMRRGRSEKSILIAPVGDLAKKYVVSPGDAIRFINMQQQTAKAG